MVMVRVALRARLRMNLRVTIGMNLRVRPGFNLEVKLRAKMRVNLTADYRVNSKMILAAKGLVPCCVGSSGCCPEVNAALCRRSL